MFHRTSGRISVLVRALLFSLAILLPWIPQYAFAPPRPKPIVIPPPPTPEHIELAKKKARIGDNIKEVNPSWTENSALQPHGVEGSLGTRIVSEPHREQEIRDQLEKQARDDPLSFLGKINPKAGSIGRTRSQQDIHRALLAGTHAMSVTLVAETPTVSLYSPESISARRMAIDTCAAIIESVLAETENSNVEARDLARRFRERLVGASRNASSLGIGFSGWSGIWPGTIASTWYPYLFPPPISYVSLASDGSSADFKINRQEFTNLKAHMPIGSIANDLASNPAAFNLESLVKEEMFRSWVQFKNSLE